MDSSAITIVKANELSSPTYLKEIESLIRKNYNSVAIPAESFPRKDWQQLSERGIMLSMIPEEFGGRNSHTELCDLIELISKYNLPLGMYTMIITALFIRNVTKYGSDELKKEVLPLFSSQALIGGFALTEPHCGSNLAKMGTTFVKTETGYQINGQKHWQAFSITADWWLVAAKSAENEKEYGYFILKREEGFKNVEEYNALGLKAIDYGRNEINAFVPHHRRLNMSSQRLDGAVDMLCASRLSMCAMASGFTSRISEEALLHAKNRKIGNGTLFNIGYVQYKLRLISACNIISKALLLYVKEHNDFRENLIPGFFEAQAVKTLSTDKMLECALNYQQLCGGDGYRYDAPGNSAAFALLDARVYTVFDGTNDLLSQQLTEYCIDGSEKGDVKAFLSSYPKTKDGMKYIDFDLDFLNDNTTQAKRVMNGQVIARIFGMHCLHQAGSQEAEKPFEYDDLINAVNFLKADIKKIAAEFEILKECYTNYI